MWDGFTFIEEQRKRREINAIIGTENRILFIADTFKVSEREDICKKEIKEFGKAALSIDSEVWLNRKNDVVHSTFFKKKCGIARI